MWQQKIAAIYQQLYHVTEVPIWLAETIWQKVELHKKSKVCRVFYQRETSFTSEEFSVVTALFGAMLPKDVSIELLWEKSNNMVKHVVVGKDAALEQGLALLYEKKPKAKLWLLSSGYTWRDENKLEISFPSQVAKDTCERLGVAAFLEAHLGDSLGNTCQVILCYEEELQASIMAAAEKREEKIIASALVAQKVSKGYSGPIYGKYIYDSPIAIAAVFDREDFCVVRGEIIAVTESRLKSGKNVYLLTIYDDSGYLPLKISASKDKEFFPEYLVPGQWIKCRGKYGMDRFSGEVLFAAFDVEGISHPVWGSDLADEKRVELCLHTKEESFSGVIPVEQGVYTAAKWGQHGIGVANLHSVAAFPCLDESCKAYAIKPIYGMELHVLTEVKRIGTVTLWAKDKEGLALIYRLLGTVFHHESGVPDGVAFQEFSHMMGEGEARCHIFIGLDWKDASSTLWQSQGRDLVDYLLVAPLCAKEEQQQQKAMIQWAEEQGIGVIATDGASCYSERQEKIVRFLQENGGRRGKKTLCKIMPTDSLLKAFYYLGEEKAKKIIVDEPEGLYRQIQDISPLGRQSLGYPANEEFWKTVLDCAKKKYDGVIPREVSLQLEGERKHLMEKGYYWLYPVLLQLKEKYGGLFLQDALLTSYVLGLTRDNPLADFISCRHCGYSGTAKEYRCPNCGEQVQELGTGTATAGGCEAGGLQKITLCGLPENQEQIWQDLSVMLLDCLVIAPGRYRQLSWEGTEAMAEIFLSGEEREELPGERQWFAATCRGMLLGVEPEHNTRLLIPQSEEIYQLTPMLERGELPYTYFPEEILRNCVLSVHYQESVEQQLFWDIYQLLPPYRQAESMQARNWADDTVWTMLKNQYVQGIPYLEQLVEADRELLSVEQFARAVADCIGTATIAKEEDGDEIAEQGDLPADADAALQSIEEIFRCFGKEIGFAWDICQMKAHSPEIFYGVVLNNLADRSNFRDMWLEKMPYSGNLGRIIKEMKAQGIAVLPIDVNASQSRAFTWTEKGFLPSLDSTTAFDSDLISSIDFYRKQGKFSSQKDFFQRLTISPHLQHLFLTEHLLDHLPEESQTSLF